MNVGKTVGVISGAEQDCDIQESNKLAIAALRCRDVVSDGIMFGASMDGGRMYGAMRDKLGLVNACAALHKEMPKEVYDDK